MQTYSFFKVQTRTTLHVEPHITNPIPTFLHISFPYLACDCKILSSSLADFEIGSRTFEIGGKSKGRRQIEMADEGYVVKDNIEFSSGLFDEATFTLSSQFFDTVYDCPIFHTTSEHRELLAAWEKLFVRITQCQAPKSAYMMLRNHLQNFFIGMENIVMSEGIRIHIQPISTTRQLFNRFCHLLVEHCHAQHEVKFYAEKLCITPYCLSKITNKTLNMTPKELIDRQIIMEMKHLLTSTDISIKELTACFHFDTMSYMARFFRRHTGLTPNEFRKQ